LYIHYAEAINEYLDIPFRVNYCLERRDNSCNPPALKIATTLVKPSDGVIISPEDLVNCLQGKFEKKKLTELHRILDGVQEQLMEEWSNE
jgi:cystathionine gamma-synthase